ncbi:MAG TPA: HNH endonuclease signature motif containing protein [Mycobacterium sp.]|nr:HNH endonuclease signature motif containing protein [Mycobacterium sp.]
MSRSREDVEVAYKGLDAALDAVAALSYDVLTVTEKKDLLVRLESHRRRLPSVEHPLIGQLVAEGAPEALGGASHAEVLTLTLRVSTEEAKRRLAEARDLGPRRSLTGDQLEPLLPATASAQADGEIGAENVNIVRKYLKKLPTRIDEATRARAEKRLADMASEFGPADLRKLAERMVATIDQDGPPPTDAERRRNAYFTVGEQGTDGMSEVRGRFDPEARAYWEALQAKCAAPGMCNPDDDEPVTDGQPAEETARRDTRTQGQRNHDAFKAIARSVLAAGTLGQKNGLPVSVIVSTTLPELESAAGQAVTGGGSLLPMKDLIRMAGHAYHYLTIFDGHTRLPLYLGRTRRCASPGQRIVLHSLHRGCTFPGCTEPGYRCQVHHAKRPWARGGQTNIDEEVLACQAHNLLVERGGWTTRIRHDGKVEWIPPPHLDHGQARINYYHHPEWFFADGAGDEGENVDQ